MIDLLTRSFGTLNGWQWLTLFSIPPLIIALYFLKLKRQPLEVPSTYLWHRTLEDLHVNSLWQRLRKNILLFLQLLVLLLAILTCLRPSWEGSKLSADRYIFLIDSSASMAGTDLEPTRLEAAKDELIKLIDQELKTGSVAMIISFSDRAIVEQPFTDNRQLLRRRIRNIKQTNRTTEIDEALRVAAGLANPGRSGTDESDVAAAEAKPATIVIFSDGRLNREPNFSMGNLTPVYRRMGSTEAKNVGIVAFSSGQSDEKPDELQVFARLQNFAEQDRSVTVNLTLNGSDTILDAARVDVPAGGIGGVEFIIDAIDTGELKLVIEEADDLIIDNEAYAAVNPRRRARVLYISPRNDALETVLRTTFAQNLAIVDRLPSDQLGTENYQQMANNGAYDLIIYDQCRPEEMPPCNTYFIGVIPPDPRWTSEPTEAIPQIIDVDQAHPLMRFVEMDNVKYIVEGTPLTLPAGGSILIDSQLGPIMGIAPREGFEDLVQGFEIVGEDDAGETFANTDWPIRTSFPIFIGNVLTYLGGSKVEAAQVSSRPGQPIALRTRTPVNEIRVIDPNQKSTTIQRGGQNTFLYGGTDQLGVYQVKEGKEGQTSQRFSVNLFDIVESDIQPDLELRTGPFDIEGQKSWETTRREAWKWLLLAGLVVLMIEWYIYNQRVYV
ncbi:MAG: VWA domain-containing protein [Planctomycetaceae bacterium]|nr:VWA domain-containing protein [Planctomycetaceae bacterium]